VLPAHNNNLRETAGQPHIKSKMKIASRLDSFFCLCDFDMLTHIGDGTVSKELKIPLHAVCEETRHSITDAVHNNAFCNTDDEQKGKHVVHVLMIDFRKTVSPSICLPISVSSSSCSLSSFISSVFSANQSQ